MTREYLRSSASAGAGSVVELVALRALPRVGLGVLGGVRVAGAGRAGHRMRLLAERLLVRIGRVARIVTVLIRVGPLGGIRLADGVVERVVRLRVNRAVAGIAFAFVHRAGTTRSERGLF